MVQLKKYLDILVHISVILTMIACFMFAYRIVGISEISKADKQARVFGCEVEWENVRDVAVVFTGDCPMHHDFSASFIVGYLTKQLDISVYGDEGSSGTSPDQRHRFIHTINIVPIIRM